MTALGWIEFVDGAKACGWMAYVGTVDGRGRPHVAVVSPGYGDEGTVWFGTRPGSTKLRNLRSNPGVAMHWPIGARDAPGECFARGTATLHEGLDARRRVWQSGVMPYDLAQFFGSPDNEDHLFVEVTLTSASILGPNFVRQRWAP